MPGFRRVGWLIDLAGCSLFICSSSSLITAAGCGRVESSGAYSGGQQAVGENGQTHDERRFIFTELMRPTPCFPRQLPVVGDGADCALTVTTIVASSACDCGARALDSASQKLRSASLATLERESYCGHAGEVACEDLCVCVVPQLRGSDGVRCRNEPSAKDLTGWCYVAPEQGLGDKSQLAMCNDEQARTVHLLGPAYQPNNALVLSCYER